MSFKQSNQTIYNTIVNAALPAVRSPANVYVSCKFPENLDQYSLLPEEQKYLHKYGDKRTVDFCLGRACAREILIKIGFERFPVLIGDDRQPLWPDKLVGSISHTDQFALCVIAEKRELSSIGVDIERINNESFDLYSMVASVEEMQNIGGDTHTVHQQCTYLAKLLFSAKEAVYKCQFPLYRRWLDFKDVTLNLDFTNKTFDTVVIDKDRPISIQGAWDTNDNYIIATAWVLSRQ